MDNKHSKKLDINELNNVSGGEQGLTVEHIDNVVASILRENGLSSVDQLPESMQKKINRIYANVREANALMKENDQLFKERTSGTNKLVGKLNKHKRS